MIELLKTNLNASATAKQLGVNHKTVLTVAKKERIDIQAMRRAAKGRKTLPFTQWARALAASLNSSASCISATESRWGCPSLNTTDTEAKGPQRMRLILSYAIVVGQLPKGTNPPPGVCMRPIPQSTKRMLTRLAGLPSAEMNPTARRRPKDWALTKDRRLAGEAGQRAS